MLNKLNTSQLSDHKIYDTQGAATLVSTDSKIVYHIQEFKTNKEKTYMNQHRQFQLED